MFSQNRKFQLSGIDHSYRLDTALEDRAPAPPLAPGLEENISMRSAEPSSPGCAAGHFPGDFAPYLADALVDTNARFTRGFCISTRILKWFLAYQRPFYRLQEEHEESISMRSAAPSSPATSLHTSGVSRPTRLAARAESELPGTPDNGRGLPSESMNF